jgi:molecular chaperone Hsp33
MLMAKSPDILQCGLLRNAKVRWCSTDVSHSSRELGQAHLCGPTAELAQAESLVAAALLSSDLTRKDEAVSIRLQVDGPLKNAFIEATHEGALRGYTAVKVLNKFDGEAVITSAKAWGDRGEAAILRSLPGKLISQATVACSTPVVVEAINQYFNLSLQRSAFSVVAASATAEGVSQARGLLVECLPDGDRRTFEALRDAVGGAISEELELADTPAGLWGALNYTDISFDQPRHLFFACRCSRASALRAVSALSTAERRQMIAAAEQAEIDCHMCGKHYTITVEELNETIE